MFRLTKLFFKSARPLSAGTVRIIIRSLTSTSLLLVVAMLYYQMSMAGVMGHGLFEIGILSLFITLSILNIASDFELASISYQFDKLKASLKRGRRHG